MDSEELLGDVIASVIEKVLMKIGVAAHAKVSDILEVHNLDFSHCYQNPDVLNLALKDVFGNDYRIVVETIRTELHGLSDDGKNIAKFIQKLNK